MPGVPGAGLSGLFYVISALVSLVVELVATARGRSSVARWLVVVRVCALAAGIVVSINVVYSVVKLIFPDEQPLPELAAGGTATAETPAQPLDAASLELLPVAPVLMTVGTLALVLGITLLLGFVARGRGPGGQPAMEATIDPPAEESSEQIAA